MSINWKQVKTAAKRQDQQQIRGRSAAGVPSVPDDNQASAQSGLDWNAVQQNAKLLDQRQAQSQQRKNAYEEAYEKYKKAASSIAHDQLSGYRRTIQERQKQVLPTLAHDQLSGYRRTQQQRAEYDRLLGQYGAGNVDLHSRPQYKNADGSISTVDSVGFNIDGKEVLLPSVWMKNGKPYHSENDDEILQHYYDTGEYLGRFDSVAEANSYASKLHTAQDYYYTQQREAAAQKTMQQDQLRGMRRTSEELDRQIDALYAERQDNHFRDFSFDEDGTAYYTDENGKKVLARGIDEIDDEIAALEERKAALDADRALDQADSALGTLDAETRSLLKDYNGVNLLKKTDAGHKLRQMGYTNEQIGRLAEYEKYLQDFEDYQTRMAGAQQFGRDAPVFSTVTSSLLAPFKALGNVESLRGVLPRGFGGYQNPDMPTNIYSPLYSATHVSSGIRSGVMEDMGPVGQFLYQAGTSALDSAVNMAVSTGLVGMTGLSGEAASGAIADTMNWVMGSQVAADSVYEGIQSGKSNERALIDGIVEGAIEGITEKYSVGDIIENMLSGEAAWKKIVRAFASEGAEEVASNWLNRLYDAVARRGRNELYQSYAQYLAQGMSEKQALAAVLKDMAAEDATSFLAGGLSGWAMSGAYAATNKAVENYSRQEQLSAFGQFAEVAMNTGDEATVKAAQAVMDKVEAGQIPDAEEVQAVVDAAVATDARTRESAQREADFQTYSQYADERDAKARNAERASRARSEEYTEAINDSEANSAEADFEALSKEEVQGAADARTRQQAEEARTERQFARESRDAADRALSVAASRYGYDERMTSVLLSGYDGAQDAQQYAEAVNTAYEYGRNGLSLTAARRAAEGIDKALADEAWSAGKEIANGEKAGAARPDDGGKRNAGMDSGKQAGAVAEGAGGAKKRSAEAKRVQAGVELENRVRAAGQPYLSGKDIGLSKGSAQRSFREAPESTWTDGMKAAAGTLKRAGFTDVHFTVGSISVENQRAKVTRYVDGAAVGDTVWVNATAKKWSVEQIANHESFHRQVQDAPYLMDSVRAALADELGEDGIQELAQKYAEAYEGCYDADELDAYIEEVCADAYAGMDRLPDAKTQIIQKAARQAQEAQQAAEENGGTRGPPEKYSVNEGFSEDVAEWYRDGMPEGESFTLGSTGETLQGLGAIESDIYMNGDKISTILKEHPEMTIREIQKIPELLDDPILILKSKGSGKGGNSRLVLFGSINTQDGQPVLAVLDLRPRENGFVLDDMQKVNSAYAKANPASFVSQSDVLFADKKRTVPLLRRFGLTVTSRELLRDGSIGSISYRGNSVNISGEKFSSIVQMGDRPMDAKFSAEDVSEADAEAEAEELQVEKLPQANRDQFMRFATKITDDLVTPLTAQMETLRKEMRPRVLELVDEFLENDALKRSSVEAAFTEAYDRALELNQEFSEKYAALQYAIRKTPVTFTEEDTRQIEQYDYFDEAALRKLTIKEKGGVSIGELYSDLSGMLPELFPSGIKNPAKQIMRIASVYKRISKAQALAQQVESTNPEYFRQNAYNDFLEQLRKIVPKMRTERELAQISIEEEAAMGKAAAERERRLAEEDARLAAEEAAKEPPTVYENLTMDSIPKKAQDYLRRVRGQTAAAIQQTLSMPFAARQEVLKPAIEEMMNEYLQTGRISQETVDRNFEESYRRGVEMDTEFYDQYKDVKTRLRDLKVTLSEADRADIADFGDFRRAASGRLRIADEGGLPVDVAYKQMREMAPELFPASITHPADQLMRMFEVSKRIQTVERSLDEYHGENAEEFRRWAKNDYEASVENMLGSLRVARRYAEARMRQTQARTVPKTLEEVKGLYAELKKLRRTYERTASKNLLTAEDNNVLNRLLRGELAPEDVQGMENSKGILAMYEAKADYDAAAAKIADWRRYQKSQKLATADAALKNADKAKDKAAGIQYSRETMTRNVRDIFPEADAEIINRTYFEPVRTASANANKLKNQLREQVKALDLSRKARKGDAVSEAHAVQLLGEAQDNIRYLEQHPRAKDRDGKTLNEWRQIVLDLWATSPGLDRAKIENAVETFRKIYDGLFEQMNDVRIRNGYEPINYRQGYFPHFQPGTTDGILGLMGKALGIDAEVTALPTTISGLTHTFKPGITYFGNALERIGFATAYDAVEGFDKYVEGAASVICYTDVIQNLRALAEQVRYRTSDEGLRERVDDIRAREDLSEQDKELRIKEIMEKGRYSLSNFAVELDEYTNLLANKKSKYDRSIEHLAGRKTYNLLKAWENRVAANMVAVNPASWLTNFGVITQAGAQLKTTSVLKAMAQTLQGWKTDDGFVDRSDFLTNRRGSDPLIRSWQQSASAVLSKPMDWIDTFSADTIVRARYMENIERGMSEETAMREADDFAANVMADRSKGAMPTLFEARNPIMKMFTQFQLEVNNTFSYLFKDLPREQRKKGIGALAYALFKFLIGGYLYNEVYEYFIGRRPMLDPLGIINDTVGDLTGYELNNLVDAATGGGLIKESEPEGAVGTIQNLAENVGQEAPFVGNLLGGGKLPYSSSMPNVKNILTALDSETATDEEKLAKVGKELVNPAAYWLLPFGGGQVKKIWQGINALKRQGSYTADGRLQYPIYSDREGDKANAAARTLLFGKSATPEAQAWVEAGFGALSEKATQTYEAMRAGGVDQRDSYELIKAMSKVKKTDDASRKQLQMQLLLSFDIEDSGKFLYYYHMMANDEERAELDELLAEGADMNEYLRYMGERSGGWAELYNAARTDSANYAALRQSAIAAAVEGGKTQKEAESEINSALRSQLKEDYKSGKADDQAVGAMLKKYFDADEHDVYWTLEEWKGGDDWKKYGQFLDAAEKGVAADTRKVAKYYMSHGVEKGTLSSQLTTYFKERWLAASGDEATRLKNAYISAYKAIGGDADKARENMIKWRQEANKKKGAKK
nr:MAG TPA: hypothetical protein [Caudoviricetes sp.]